MPHGTIELDFADGRYSFCVAKLAQIFELQEKCDAGPNQIFERLRAGTWRVNDFRETIRLGLIGAGMEPLAALKLVRRYVDERPWHESVLTGAQILMAALVGVPGDPLDFPKAEEAKTGQTTASSAPTSTEPPRRSASRRVKSTK